MSNTDDEYRELIINILRIVNLSYETGIDTNNIVNELYKRWVPVFDEVFTLTEMNDKDFIHQHPCGSSDYHNHSKCHKWFIRPKGLEHLAKEDARKFEREKIEAKRQLQEQAENNAMYCQKNE